MTAWFRTLSVLNIEPLVDKVARNKLHNSGQSLSDYNCIICSRKVRKGNKLMVHCVNGSPYEIVKVNEPAENIHEAGDMGWWDIGPDCAKKLPEGYVGQGQEILN